MHNDYDVDNDKGLMLLMVTIVMTILTTMKMITHDDDGDVGSETGYRPHLKILARNIR